MAQNPEHMAIKKCIPQLVETLALNLITISDELYAKSFITSSVYKEMRTPGVAHENRAGQLVENVLCQVKMKPTKFSEFIDVLNNEPSHSGIVERLEGALKECREQSSRKRSRPSSFTDDISEGLSPAQARRMRLSSLLTTSSSLSMEQQETDTSRPDPPILLPSSVGGGSMQPEFREVMELMDDVSDWRSLGCHLEVKSAKLNEIAKYPPEEQKAQLVLAWFSMGNCTWDKLVEALEKPSVSGVQAAKKARRMSATHFKGSSVEADCPPRSLGENLLPFTEANVLDAVIKISNYHELGARLRVPAHILDNIDKNPVEDRRQLFVMALFQNTECNWNTLNLAIKEVELQEWATQDLQRSGSLTKSVSTESKLSQMSSAVVDDSVFNFSKKMVKSNTTKIRGEYSKLKNTVKKKLRASELDMDDFYWHIVDIFKPEDVGKLIPDASVMKDVDTVFKVLSDQNFWGFEDVSQLKSLVDRFIKGVDRAHLLEMIRDYKYNLNGYRANTKIIDRVQADGIEENEEDDEYESIVTNPTKYNKKYRKTLSAKLFKSTGGDNVLLTMKSLEYVQEVWNDMCDEFDIPLTAVLDKIKGGCIQVTWLIPPQSATKVLDHITNAATFLQSRFISNLLLEDIVIYSESVGVASQEILDEVQLLLAVLDESVDRTRTVLQSYSGDMNAQLVAKNNMTVLSISTHDGTIEIASALLQNGADMNKQDVSGWSALFHAVSEGHLDMVCRLLEDEEDVHHEADLTLKDVTGSTVLDLALKCDHSEIHNTLKTELDNHLVIRAKKGDLSSVEQFLKMGADVDATDPIKDQWTSLTWASWRGYLDIVNHLLKCDASVNVTSGTGFSPLILSSREGHCEVMKSLLDHGANVELKTKKGWSSLMMTADFGWVEAGKLLLEHGADMNCLTSNNNTPFSIACQNGKHDFVRMLIEQNPDLDLDEVPKGSWTPLMLACRRGHLETVKVLLEKGADVDKAKEDSIGPLHIACFEGYNEVVNFLIHMNVDTNVADCCDVTPLMMAIKEGHFRAFKKLISDSRTNLNLQEKNVKHSAVFFAVHCNRLEMLDSLLKTNRLDLGIRDIGGNTVLEYAEKNNPEAFSFLQKNHKDKFEQMRVSHKRLPQVTHKELASRVNKMMQSLDIRMGREVAASAA